MKRFLELTSLFMAVLIFVTSCSSTTLIQTKPPGATVYIDGIIVGKSPYSLTDQKIVSSCTDIRLEYPGYETITNQICKDEEINVGPAIAGFFFLVPWLWSFKYKASHYYEMSRSTDAYGDIEIERERKQNEYEKRMSNSKSSETKSLEQKLNELQELKDKGLITESEYKKSKAKLLDL